MRVRFVGADRGAGRQFAGETYFPGDVADLSPAHAAAAVRGGWAVPVEADPPEAVRVAVPEVEHRDPPVGRKRRRS